MSAYCYSTQTNSSTSTNIRDEDRKNVHCVLSLVSFLGRGNRGDDDIPFAFGDSKESNMATIPRRDFLFGLGSSLGALAGHATGLYAAQ